MKKNCAMIPTLRFHSLTNALVTRAQWSELIVGEKKIGRKINENIDPNEFNRERAEKSEKIHFRNIRRFSIIDISLFYYISLSHLYRKNEKRVCIIENIADIFFSRS